MWKEIVKLILWNLAEVAKDVTNNGFLIETIYDDVIPDERRSRRQTKTTKFERILIMQKVQGSE
jgi:hypothetical protein